MNKILKICMPMIVTGLIGLTAGNLFQGPQKSPPPFKNLEFQYISNVPIGNGIYKYTLPNKNGYLIVVRGGGGEMATTYIPREVTWEIK